MTARTSYKQRQQISELSFSLAMNEARVQLAQDRARRRQAAAAARLAALEPMLAAAGYGPHGGAERLRAEARAIRAASRSAAGTEHTGPGCRVCARARASEGGATGYREIAR